MQKRIIAFRRLKCLHTGKAIFDCIFDIFTKMHIHDKILSITFDNASTNNFVIKLPTSTLTPPKGTSLLYMKFVCHIIILIVQDGLN